MENLLGGLDNDNTKILSTAVGITMHKATITEKIQQAQRILNGCKSTSEKIKMGKFVIKKNKVQEILNRLKDIGLLSMTALVAVFAVAAEHKLLDKVEKTL